MIRKRMLTLALTALLALATGCAATGGPWQARPAHVGTRVSVSIFYDDLAPYGHWFAHATFGWVWTPYDVPYGWRPYTHGHWVYTEFGWTWVSHWRWGWAPFHYGRWVFDPGYGWVWIPGTVWGPAWVVWRWSDDWVGWAPLPPDAGWQVGVGLRVGDAHRGWDPDPACWSFTRAHRLLDRDLRYRLEPPHRNRTLMERTRAAARYDELGGRPRDLGRDVGEVEMLVGRPVQRFRIVDARGPREGERLLDRGDVRVYRPEVSPAPDARPPVTKPAPPVTTDAERMRREQELRRLESHYKDETQQMKERQREEVRRTPPGDAEELKRRHEAEKQALEQQKERERKVREERIEKRIEKPAPAPKPPAKPAPAREKGRGGKG
jgi:hypothetical protein